MKLHLVLFLAGTVSAFPFSFTFPNWLCDIALQVFHDVAPTQLAEASTYCSSFIRPTVKAVSTTTSTSSVAGPITTVATTTLVSTQTSTVVTTSTSTTTTGTSTSVVTSAIDLGTSTTVVTITQTTTSGTTYVKKRHEPTLVARAPPPPGVWSKLAAADKSAGCSCVLMDHLPSPSTSFTSTLLLSTTVTGSPTPVTATTSSVTTVQSTSTSIQMLSVEATSTSTSTISTYGVTSTSTQTATVTVPSSCPTDLGRDFNSFTLGSSSTGGWQVSTGSGTTYTISDGGIEVGFEGGSFSYISFFYIDAGEVCNGQTIVLDITALNTGTTQNEWSLQYGVEDTGSGTAVKSGSASFIIAEQQSSTFSESFSATYSYTPELSFSVTYSGSSQASLLLSFIATAST